MAANEFGDVTVEIGEDHVATVEMHRPPSNFFDTTLIRNIADAYRWVDESNAGWAIVLCSEGKHFCAGADFHGASDAEPLDAQGASALYAEAVKMFSNQTPVVAALQGAAVGGGLGVACSADFRFATPESRLSANFARLGFHQGFGLSVTLPLIVGHQRSLDLLYTGRRLTGEEAHTMGLVDRLVAADELRAAAHAFALEIAQSAPLAVRSIRQTLRGQLPAAIREITRHEDAEQVRLRATADFAEGTAAYGERRPANFTAS
ncbi:enoyl-CoA hydratase/isomerase family protein [Acidiferrimicrobium sp. IK]|uniref:enoyl-CoA hydratase/isomerase family protein n=1 Tax=Acidiferrimicrobium sp. IK TaxID=2871700 RepID=UPI0021CB696E|nr:enoyl-CoA hydratase/isomerase family protein [Acidiferrimicrobium sp. IK]MCU4183403.1 enoyl-CoA hydratase/isomerase family protein [Acidiferrimicrobium sp. IK]